MNEPAPPDSDDTIHLTVSAEEAGMRLDLLLARHRPERSRSRLVEAIRAGTVLVDGRPAKPSVKLKAGQQIEGRLPEMPREGPEPENVPLDVLYEDDWLVAVNKPPGMIVHPAKGHWAGTLAGALAYHFEQLSSVGGPTRPGIVHRLDRDTSGVLVVAKTDRAHQLLAEQFEARTTEKHYFAVVAGVPDRDQDIIQQPIGPHPSHREKMAIRPGHPSSREATTRFQVERRFDGFASLWVYPKTGRTHQIRVHLTHIGYSVLCDPLYGGRAVITEEELAGTAARDHVVLNRIALHAYRLKLAHPATGQPLEWIAPLPDDILRLLEKLEQYRPLPRR